MLGPFCLLWRGIKYFAQFAFLTRFAILYLIILLLLAACAWRDWSLVLRNVFLVETKTRIFWLSLMSFLSVALCLSTIRVTLLGGHLRFKDFVPESSQAKDPPNTNLTQDGAGKVAEDWSQPCARVNRERGQQDGTGKVAEDWSLAPKRTFSGWDPVLWVFAWLFFGSLVPAACLLVNHRQDATGVYTGAGEGIGMMLAGAGLTAALLCFASYLSGTFGFGSKYYELTPFDRIGRASAPGRLGTVSEWMLDRICFKDWPLFSGYFEYDAKVKKCVFAPGHWELTFATLVLALVTYFLYKKSDPADPWLPTLYDLLLVLSLLQLILSAAAFFFDYWRVPTLLLVVVYLYFSNWIWPVDHFFVVQPRAKIENQSTRNNDSEPASDTRDWSAQSIENYLSMGSNPTADAARTLVLVNAAGGGIQAAAWTARVLTGLHEAYPKTFPQATIVISGVSGGSVGALFYLAGAEALRSPHESVRKKASALINKSVRESGLEATGWGLAFPDFWRTAFGPFSMIPLEMDRGLSLETVWDTRLGNLWSALEAEQSIAGKGDVIPLRSWKNCSIRHYLHRLNNPPITGRDPIVIFNTTKMDDGKRFLISPLAVLTNAGDNGAEEFLGSYEDLDVGLATATRLSASFSYVSPIARPLIDGKPNPKRSWLADGGYADNEGLMTNIDILIPVLRQLLSREKDKRSFDRVLVLRLLPFPMDDSPEELTEHEKAVEGAGLIIKGPISLLNKVRQSTQIDRGTRALQFVQSLLESDQQKKQQGPNAPGAPAQLPVEEEHASERLAAAQAARRIAQLQALRLGSGESSRPPPSEREEGGPNAKRDDATESAPTGAAVEFGYITFRYELSKDGMNHEAPPLSWKLSASEKKAIDQAWAEFRDGSKDDPLKTKFITDGWSGAAKNLNDIFGPAQPLVQAAPPATAK